MEEKNELVIKYINVVRDTFEKKGYPIPENIITMITNKYIDSPLSFEEIRKEINKLVEEKLEEIWRRMKSIDDIKQKIVNGISDLSVDTKGITLNMQQIDLLSIVSANKDNLEEVLNNIYNLSDEEKQTILSSDKNIEDVKRDLFKMYQDSLTSYGDTNYKVGGKDKELQKRINYIINNSKLNQEDKTKLIDIIKNNELYDIPKLIVNSFDKDTSERIISVISRYMPTEREGIKSASYESFEKLNEHLSDYQVINLDDIAKYGHYVRIDGSFNREDLIKAFDFARSHGMQTRLNTLLFYMDTPKELEVLSKQQGKFEARVLLERYVNDITKTIARYNEECIQRGEQPTVRTVEIFNELLNRFPMDGDILYDYRGNIDTEDHRITEDNPNYDNLRGGWLRFFDIDELCSIMEIARKNLPNVNLMLNECTLEDPNKLEPFKKIIVNKIREYEEKHGIKLIDSIGTQMHINSSVTKDDMRNMFNELSKYNIPIEVTEFDMSIDQEFIKSHSKEEIEDYKRDKLNDFCEVVAEMQEKGNIKGVTIWSVSDNQNFIVHLINQKIADKNIEREKSGLEPIPYVETVYGGYYDSDMNDITKKKEDTNIIEKENIDNNKTNMINEMMVEEPVTVEKENIEVKEQPKVYTKESNNSSSQGFINSIMTVVISTLLIVLIVGIGYIVYNLNLR